MYFLGFILLKIKRLKRIDYFYGIQWIAYFDKICAIVRTLRQAPDLADSFLQNQIDNVEDLIYSTKYKLVNLQ